MIFVSRLERRARVTCGEPPGKAWDQRVFERLDSGVDPTLIAANLLLTPTERVEKMMRALDLILELRAARANRPSNRP